MTTLNEALKRWADMEPGRCKWDEETGDYTIHHEDAVWNIDTGSLNVMDEMMIEAVVRQAASLSGFRLILIIDPDQAKAKLVEQVDGQSGYHKEWSKMHTAPTAALAALLAYLEALGSVAEVEL
jgi:hypothetical protein